MAGMFHSRVEWKSPPDNRIRQTGWRDAAVVPLGRTSAEPVEEDAASATEPTGNKAPRQHVTTCITTVMEDPVLVTNRGEAGRATLRCTSVDSERAVADSSRTRWGSTI
jgi:hypothetical protein